MTRDLTKTQFEKACAAYGFKKDFFGYWDLGGVLVCAGNAGDNRRARLAYLVREKEKHGQERHICVDTI